MSRPIVIALVTALAACGSSNKEGDKQPQTPGPLEGGGTGGAFCLPPKISCGAGCVDPLTDPGHCGGCGRSCGDDLCVGGKCHAAGGDCREEGNPCPPSYYCDLGVGQCKPGCATDDHCAGNACNPLTHGCCLAGQQVCAGECVDPQRDAAHCGACGNVCPAAVGTTAVCNGGACGLGCEGGLTLCETGDYDGAGACADLQRDAQHCGSCFNTCPAPYGGSASCVAGKCQQGCSGSGSAVCDGSCVDLQSDVDHCGSCGVVCSATDGMPSCVAGKCEVSCPSAKTLCGDSTCVDLQTDKDNCGQCDKKCPDGREGVSYPVCSAGKCAWACTYSAYKCGTMCCAPGEPCCGTYCLKPGYSCY